MKCKNMMVYLMNGHGDQVYTSLMNRPIWVDKQY